MDGDRILYEDMMLYIEQDKFYIEPTFNAAQILIIDRVSLQDITLEDNVGQIPTTAIKKSICGIIGSIQLLAGPYLIVVTGKKHIGKIAGHDIWQVLSTELICFRRTLTHLTDTQERMNKLYLSMLETVLAIPNFYFSYTFDITHTLQRLHNNSPEFLKLPLHLRADPSFLWNTHLLNQFCVSTDCYKFCLPLMFGFISINQCSLNGKPFTWALISRRSCNRAGTRLYTRGVDESGHVANFVETEQIIESSGDRSSFVQTRGSIPLFWQQLPNLRYKPKPALIVTENHFEAFGRHFDSQLLDYGRQVLINLVDHRGSEGELEKAYAEMVNRLGNSNLRYESFDFHHECRKMRWDRLSILIDRLAYEQDEFGYFMLLRDGTLGSLQDGVFRTNCIDCLDRTNVVQSMLARRSLNNVLQKLAILQQGQTIDQHSPFETLFKSVWADNADYISIQYSGTGALKTDFTRTGKRTQLGLIKDGVNSITRYYKNNFTDGFRQDAIDLFLGHYVVNQNECVTTACPLEVNRGWKYFTFPLILCVAVAMFFANVVTPTEYSTATLLYLLFWGSMIGVTFTTIMYYGVEFVDSPCLRMIRNIHQSQA
uniref:Phosphatidylinositol-3-phosphatase SAC1 n=1 Tax=Clastoptera arizonana TaxID=38151 RepID=A0A1B6DBF0_9HEMI